MIGHLLLQQIQHLVKIIERERETLDAHRELTKKIASDPASPHAQQAQAILTKDKAMMAANEPDKAVIEALCAAARPDSCPAREPRLHPEPRSQGWIKRIGNLLP